MIISVFGSGFIMFNCGFVNMNIIVEFFEESDIKIQVRINLECVVVKLMVRNDSKEIYMLKNFVGVIYVIVCLNNYKFINLVNKFYIFCYVVILDNVFEILLVLLFYSVEVGNFGNIVDNNGYFIDFYFFDKIVVGVIINFIGGLFYINYLLKQIDSNWLGLVDVGKYVFMYCFENCMFCLVQNMVYIIGIMLKGIFIFEVLQIIGNNGNLVEDLFVFNILYYFNYKFYIILVVVGKYGDVNIDGLIEEFSDVELVVKQIICFIKNGGNFFIFYNYWIKYFDNNNFIVMGVMEFGIVCNNIYFVNIISIKNLGFGILDIKFDLDENKVFLDVEFGVYLWIVCD